MKLTYYLTEDGYEGYINKETGESFMSPLGYSNVVSISEEVVQNKLKESQQDVIYTTFNNKNVILLTEKWIVVNMEKDNPEVFKLFVKMGKEQYEKVNNPSYANQLRQYAHTIEQLDSIGKQ